MKEHKKTFRERRMQISRAALQIIARQGVGKLTTARLAREVGLSEAALYKYFASKNEILYFALEFVHDMLADKMAQIMNGDGGPMEKLAGLIRFQFAFLQENQGIPRVIFSEQLYIGDQLLKEMYLKTINKYFSFLRGLVEEGIKGGVFRNDLEPDMAATACMGLVQTTVFRWSLAEDEMDLTGRADKIIAYLKDCWECRGGTG